MAAPLSKLQRRARRTLRITLTWVLAGLGIALWESNALESYGHDPERLRSLDTHFWRFLTVGLLGAGAYIFLLRDRLRTHEALLARQGLLSSEAVDQYEPSAAELALRSAQARELVEAIASDLGPRP